MKTYGGSGVTASPFFSSVLDGRYTDKYKIIPVTGRGGPYACETSMLPHFVGNRWFTDGGEVVSLTRRSNFTPQKVSWY
jgi:hypothetical protein